MKIITLLMMLSVSGLCCKAYLSNMSKVQTFKMDQILKSKGFDIVDKASDSDIQLILSKENYFNIYGYPHFFMRNLKLSVIFDQSKILEANSSDGFPVYTGFRDILQDLKESTFRCVDSQIIR